MYVCVRVNRSDQIKRKNNNSDTKDNRKKLIKKISKRRILRQTNTEEKNGENY